MVSRAFFKKGELRTIIYGFPFNGFQQKLPDDPLQLDQK